VTAKAIGAKEVDENACPWCERIIFKMIGVAHLADDEQVSAGAQNASQLNEHVGDFVIGNVDQ
jgi:hypothetical protein